MLETATSQNASVSNFATGTFTGDGTAIEVLCGFKPRHIRVVNVTDVETWDKYEGMPAANSIKTVTAGATTVDTGSAVVITENGFTLLAAEFGSADVVYWAAWG